MKGSILGNIDICFNTSNVVITLVKVIKSEIFMLAYDKVSQALINQLPFYAGLLFLTRDYQEYYQIITVVFLGISFGNLGLERVFTNSDLNIYRSLRKIVYFRIFFGILVFFFLAKYMDVGLKIAIFSSLIVLTNFTSLSEFLYIGNHLRKPLIIIKVFIVLIGFFLRYKFNDNDSFIMILFFESIVFGIILVKTLVKTNSFVEISEVDSVFKSLETFYGFLLLGLTFLVTRIYIYYDLGLSMTELKYLHISDYIVVVATFIGSVMIRMGFNENLKVLLNYLLILMFVVVITAFFVNDRSVFYVAAKVVSAVNVLYIYMLFSKREIKNSFLINIGSFLIMIGFLIFSSVSDVFIWMLCAESSVLILAALLIKRKKACFYLLS